jgi:subtilisin family serine protease
VQGTSFAAPLVAGVAALVRARWPTLDAANVINRLIRTARDLGPPGHDDQYGYGEVNPVRALTASVPAVRHNPLVASAEPPPVERFGARTPPDRADGTDHARLVPLAVLVSAAAGLVTFCLMLVAALVAVRHFTRHHAG